MEKEIIAIGHPEDDYAERLADYINDNGLLNIQLIAFSSKSKYKEFVLRYNPKYKIIVEEWKEESEENTFYFCEEKEEEKEELIYRYQPADRIAARIRDVAHLKPGCIKGDGTKFSAVYSPVGRCLKTSFSLTLGQMLAANHRVLYLNFENYSGFGRFIKTQRAGDFTDLFYYFQNMPEVFFEKMEESAVVVNGLHLIPPALSYLDTESISQEEWERFFQAIADSGRYDYILLDLSDYLKGLYRILTRCSIIYTLAPADGVAIAKIEQYERLLNEMHYDGILKSTRKVTPPIFKRIPIEPEELLHSELAEYTRQITEADFHWLKKS